MYFSEIKVQNLYYRVQTFKYDFRKLLLVLCMEVILIVFELDENTDELTSAVF